MVESYRQYVPNGGVSLERNTTHVPCDNRYYLLHGHRVIAVFTSLKKAQARFHEVLRESGFQAQAPEPPKVDFAELAIQRYLDAKEEYWASSHKFRSGGRLINR